MCCKQPSSRVWFKMSEKTFAQRPTSWPQNNNPYWQVVVVQTFLYNMNIQNGTHIDAHYWSFFGGPVVNSVINFINFINTNFSYERRFSIYVLALPKNSYKIFAHLTFMKLTPGVDFINVLHTAFTLVDLKSLKRHWWLKLYLLRFRDLQAQKLYVEHWWNWHHVESVRWKFQKSTSNDV